MREHLSDLKERNRATIQERIDRWGGEIPSLEELERKLELNREERQRLLRERDGMETEFLKGLEEILANAYLMPYENRELAHTLFGNRTDPVPGGLDFLGRKDGEGERTSFSHLL